MSQHKSFWIATSRETDYPKLDRDLEVDVAVIGGGIVGIVAAFELTKAGRTVALIEASKLVHGITGHTTAKLTSLHGLIYHKLCEQFGEEKASTYGEANERAIDYVRSVSEQRGIDCEFAPCTACTYTADDKHVEQIEKEYAAAKKLGLPAELHDDIPLPFPIKRAVAFRGQAQFHPRKFLLGLSDGIMQAGGRIYENTRAVELAEGEPMRVLTRDEFTISARDVIVATHLPFLNTGLFFSRTKPRREYAMAMRVDPGRVPAGMFINAGSPSRSVRAARDEHGPVLILAGDAHPVGETPDHRQHWANLEEWGRSALGATEVAYRWSAQDYQSIDELPFIGKMSSGSDHLFTATGFNAWGMTNGVVAGILISDLICGRENPWADVFDPQRTDLSSLGKMMMKTGRDVKRFTRDRLAESMDSEDTDRLPPGEGRLVEVDGEKLGVYRDENSTLHVVSAVCSHMGCIVHFNDAEGSWDCPCHGSRFSHTGEVLHGPAVTPLQSRREVLRQAQSD